jgi:hypothetical protein
MRNQARFAGCGQFGREPLTQRTRNHVKRNILASLAIAVAVAAFAIKAMEKQQLGTVPGYEVARASGTIRVDGVLDEFDWLVAPRLQLEKHAHKPEDGQPLRDRTQVAALWDDANLYLAFIVEDREIWATIRERDARLFPEECVEFFLDPDGDGRHYIEAQINSIGNIRDLLVDGSVKNPTYPQFDVMAGWDFAHLQKEIRIYRENGRDLGWTLEMAIPWKELSFSRRKWPPSPGQEMRINFYRYERPRSGSEPLELSAWSAVESSFHTPSRFGRFVFR